MQLPETAWSNPVKFLFICEWVTEEASDWMSEWLYLNSVYSIFFIFWFPCLCLKWGTYLPARTSIHRIQSCGSLIVFVLHATNISGSALLSAVYICDKTLQSQVSAKHQTLGERGDFKEVNKESDTLEIHLHWVENVKQQHDKKCPQSLRGPTLKW